MKGLKYLVACVILEYEEHIKNKDKQANQEQITDSNSSTAVAVYSDDEIYMEKSYNKENTRGEMWYVLHQKRNRIYYMGWRL